MNSRRVPYPILLGLIAVGSFLATAPHPHCVADSPTASASSTSSSITQLVAAVNQTGGGGAGHADAMAAMKSWLTTDGDDLDKFMLTLRAMKDANNRGKNWLTMVAGSLRARVQDEMLLRESLQALFDDRDQDPDARYFAYRQLLDLPSSDEAFENKLLDRSTDDPSLPLRFLAVRKAIADADALDDDAAVITKLTALLPLARYPDHLSQISQRLADRDVKVDLAEQLAMIRDWWVVAAFDNADGIGFETRYPVETDYVAAPLDPVSPDRVVAGGDGPLSWLRASSDDAMGKVDLNPIYDNAKDAVAYAYCLIEIDGDELAASDADAAAPTFQARLGCICANKAWVNGEPVLANEVYHSGSNIDQYVAACELQPGLNSVLLKICQNAQTEPWAQEWDFQFRLTDASGRGIPFKMVAPQRESLSSSKTNP